MTSHMRQSVWCSPLISLTFNSWCQRHAERIFTIPEACQNSHLTGDLDLQAVHDLSYRPALSSSEIYWHIFPVGGHYYLLILDIALPSRIKYHHRNLPEGTYLSSLFQNRTELSSVFSAMCRFAETDYHSLLELCLPILLQWTQKKTSSFLFMHLSVPFFLSKVTKFVFI